MSRAFEYPEMSNKVNRGTSTETKFMLVTIAITLTVAALSSYFHAGWMSAAALAFGMYALLGAFALRTGDKFLLKLLVFGLMAGIVELAADCWLVESTGTLLYAGGEPMIFCSPAYMPFAWAVVLVQVGYLGFLISGHKPMWQSMLATLVIGLLFIPLFEHWANGAGWWVYQNTPMIGDTPWYIILAEGLICMLLPLLFVYEVQKSYLRAIIFGVFHGLWIWLAYFVSYNLIG